MKPNYISVCVYVCMCIYNMYACVCDIYIYTDGWHSCACVTTCTVTLDTLDAFLDVE